MVERNHHVVRTTNDQGLSLDLSDAVSDVDSAIEVHLAVAEFVEDDVLQVWFDHGEGQLGKEWAAEAAEGDVTLEGVFITAFAEREPDVVTELLLQVGLCPTADQHELIDQFWVLSGHFGCNDRTERVSENVNFLPPGRRP